MKKELEKLLDFTRECREDMHEPDEQGISARVIGNKLDNAFGTQVKEGFVEGGYQEFVIVLENENMEIEKFNLATLIALARKASL